MHGQSSRITDLLCWTGENSPSPAKKPKPQKGGGVSSIENGSGPLTENELRSYLRKTGPIRIKDLLKKLKNRMGTAEVTTLANPSFHHQTSSTRPCVCAFSLSMRTRKRSDSKRFSFLQLSKPRIPPRARS